MAKEITIIICWYCDMRVYMVGKARKLDRCKCGKDERFEVRVEV